MPTDINGFNSTPGGARPRSDGVKTSSDTAKSSNASPTPSSGQKETLASDRVQLSDQAKLLNQIEDKLQDTPEVDEEKVAAIKAAIADGSYQPDAESIANKMMDMDDLL